MNNDLNILYTIAFISYIYLGGGDGLIECCRKREALHGKLSLSCPKRTFLATRSQNVDTGFQIQKKNNPLEILLICFLAPLTPLSDDFKALGFSNKSQLSWPVRSWGRKIVFRHLGRGGGGWFYRTCVFISFNFQVSRICLTPMTCVELEY